MRPVKAGQKGGGGGGGARGGGGGGGGGRGGLLLLQLRKLCDFGGKTAMIRATTLKRNHYKIMLYA